MNSARSRWVSPFCLCCLATVLLVVVPAGLLLAQDAFDDFGDDDAAFGDQGLFEDAPVGDEEAAAESAPEQPRRSGRNVTLPVEESAVVQAIRASDPQTARELMRVIDQLIRLERTDVAADYLRRLVDQNLDTAALRQLHRQFSTATWIRLSRTSELAPQGHDFAIRAMQSVRQAGEDPQRLAKLVERLASAERREQARILAELMRAGPHAVDPMVSAMAASAADDSSIVELGRAFLSHLDVDAIEPLIGQLSSPDVGRHRVAIEALAAIESPVAVPYLIGPAFTATEGGESLAAIQAIQRLTGVMPSQPEATQVLAFAARRAYDGMHWDTPDPDDRLVRWVWSGSQNRVRPISLRTQDAVALDASRLYRTLARIEPHDADNLTRYLVSRLNVDQAVGGLDQPLRRSAGSAFELARRAGVTATNRALAMALHDDHDPAAMGAAEILGDLGDPDALQRGEEGPAPLILALADDSRRVRFAAAGAMVKLRPPVSFAGAARLVDVLMEFASASGRPRVLIAHPRFSEASRVAGMFIHLGYQADPVTRGQDLLRAAGRSADTQLVVLSDALNDVSAWSMVEQLRQHPKSAELPIAILARPDSAGAADRVVAHHDNVVRLPELMDEEALLVQLPRLVDPLDRQQISPDRRVQQADTALNLLANWIDGPQRPLTDLTDWEPELLRMAERPGMTEDATRILAHLGKRSAQQALVDMASQHPRPLAQRQAAARAFEQSVERFGVLLTRSQIARQYDRYNQTRDLDRETQVLLGSVLDMIEAH